MADQLSRLIASTLIQRGGQTVFRCGICREKRGDGSIALGTFDHQPNCPAAEAERILAERAASGKSDEQLALRGLAAALRSEFPPSYSMQEMVSSGLSGLGSTGFSGTPDERDAILAAVERMFS